MHKRTLKDLHIYVSGFQVIISSQDHDIIMLIRATFFDGLVTKIASGNFSMFEIFEEETSLKFSENRTRSKFIMLNYVWIMFGCLSQI